MIFAASNTGLEQCSDFTYILSSSTFIYLIETFYVTNISLLVCEISGNKGDVS